MQNVELRHAACLAEDCVQEGDQHHTLVLVGVTGDGKSSTGNALPLVSNSQQLQTLVVAKTLKLLFANRGPLLGRSSLHGHRIG